MAISAEPAAELSHLPRADGSAVFSHSGYKVTAAVNGPLEAGRRDENPHEAIVDVIVRPDAGVGGTAERQLESILQQALRQLILLRNFPRSVIQVTLQVSETPGNVYANTKLGQARLNLHILPALLHASILGLLTAAIPMKSVAAAALLAVSHGDEIKVVPTVAEVDQASSVHVVGFTSNDELFLTESEGSFTVEEWDKVMQAGQRVCCRRQGAAGLDTPMENDGFESPSIQDFLRSVMVTQATGEMHWK